MPMAGHAAKSPPLTVEQLQCARFNIKTGLGVNDVSPYEGNYTINELDKKLRDSRKDLNKWLSNLAGLNPSDKENNEYVKQACKHVKEIEVLEKRINELKNPSPNPPKKKINPNLESQKETVRNNIRDQNTEKSGDSKTATPSPTSNKDKTNTTTTETAEPPKPREEKIDNEQFAPKQVDAKQYAPKPETIKKPAETAGTDCTTCNKNGQLCTIKSSGEYLSCIKIPECPADEATVKNLRDKLKDYDYSANSKEMRQKADNFYKTCLEGINKKSKQDKKDAKKQATQEEIDAAKEECDAKGSGYEWKKIEGKVAGVNISKVKGLFMKDTHGYYCDDSGYESAVKEYNAAVEKAREAYNKEVKDILNAEKEAVKAQKK